MKTHRFPPGTHVSITRSIYADIPEGIHGVIMDHREADRGYGVSIDVPTNSLFGQPFNNTINRTVFFEYGEVTKLRRTEPESNRTNP